MQVRQWPAAPTAYLGHDALAISVRRRVRLYAAAVKVMIQAVLRSSRFVVILPTLCEAFVVLCRRRDAYNIRPAKFFRGS